MSNLVDKEVLYLLSVKAIRERTLKVYEHILNDKGLFKVHLDKLDTVAQYVVKVIYKNYPKLDIPFHSRKAHLNAGGVDRLKVLEEKLVGKDRFEVAKAKVDLIISSVLLDAGAGNDWTYKEEGGGIYSRSEGLGVASFHMFNDGAFSSHNDLSVDALKLQKISEDDIRKYFQVDVNNPLVGIDGRVKLLNTLGKVLEGNKKVFKDLRASNLLDYLKEKYGFKLQASDLVSEILFLFRDIWPSRLSYNGFSLGDVWKYSPFGDDFESYIPIHKLSQWLTYSLIEFLEEAGFEIDDINQMTALAEYRNGGLLVDSGLIELKDKSLYTKEHEPSSQLIIEWRSLTIVLLDEIANKVRTNLNLTDRELPLVKVLEGGTWWAGREYAKSLREDMSSPIKLKSDGTVF